MTVDNNIGLPEHVPNAPLHGYYSVAVLDGHGQWCYALTGAAIAILVVFVSMYVQRQLLGIVSSPTKLPLELRKARKVRRLLVLIAMEAEARPLIDELKLVKRPSFDPIIPLQCYSGKHRGMDLYVVTNGKCDRFGVDNVGTTPAAVVAHAAATHLKPDLIINAGTAGGFRAKGGAVGDVYIGTHMKHHDRRIPIPGFTDYGRGNHEALNVSKLISALGFKSGVVSTSNSLDHTDTDDEHMIINDASVKDMEGAALAWVAEMHAIPFFCIKVVTDIVDGDRPTEEEFMENLHKAAVSLQVSVPKVINFVAEKVISDLQL